jgi:hypothetical protein
MPSGNIPVLARRYWEKLGKISVKILDDLVKIRTKHIPNTSQKHCHSSQLSWWNLLSQPPGWKMETLGSSDTFMCSTRCRDNSISLV